MRSGTIAFLLGCLALQQLAQLPSPAWCLLAAPLLLLVESENLGECALVVDSVQDQRQVVIKSLESNFGSVPGVSAATVLGDGRIALILDPDAIAGGRVTSAYQTPTILSNAGRAAYANA